MNYMGIPVVSFIQGCIESKQPCDHDRHQYRILVHIASAVTVLKSISSHGHWFNTVIPLIPCDPAKTLATKTINTSPSHYSVTEHLTCNLCPPAQISITLYKTMGQAYTSSDFLVRLTTPMHYTIKICECFNF